MSCPGANAYHKRNAARWRAHPFARASQAMDARLVEMKARHLREHLRVDAVMRHSPHSESFDVTATVMTGPRVPMMLRHDQRGYIELMRKATMDLAGAIVKKLAERADSQKTGLLSRTL